ncbi:MAG TPA: peptidoglycan-binding domain-containing protein [Chthoniobacterales bacterium]|nr:peptidoglycan-binding domain-containing protein [Chthoniobacterales bacterium]
MNRKLFLTALVLLAGLTAAWADSAIESAQQKLKDEGFYYGELNGKKDADTTAAIRRYQIRNGLQITGELNAETLRSLGLASKPASTPATHPAHTPGPTPPPGFLEETPAPKVMPAPRQQPPPEPDNEDQIPPQPQAQPPRVETSNPFGGSPYEAAPPQVQQDIVAKAQVILTRQGYYREGIDGLYGPALNFALRNYQARFGLLPSGRLDVETLASLSLLPEQRTSGPRRFHRRFFPRIRIGPGDEPIYVPR